RTPPPRSRCPVGRTAPRKSAAPRTSPRESSWHPPFNYHALRLCRHHPPPEAPTSPAAPTPPHSAASRPPPSPSLPRAALHSRRAPGGPPRFAPRTQFPTLRLRALNQRCHPRHRPRCMLEAHDQIPRHRHVVDQERHSPKPKFFVPECKLAPCVRERGGVPFQRAM